MATLPNKQTQKKPQWLKVKLPAHKNFFYISSLLKIKNLNTICQSAKCPNTSECWSYKTATFLILGDTCTRNCAFCAVNTGNPANPSPEEAKNVAESIVLMELNYVVVTSVTRDDLPDGGASFFVETIDAIKKTKSNTKIEILIPDFAGNEKSLLSVINARPDVLNHNMEVPEDLYPLINRPQKYYRRSLKVLEKAKNSGTATKSGLMIGLGENHDQILRTMNDLRQVNCDLLTIGQYLQATQNNIPVNKYYSPKEFELLKAKAFEMGFIGVEAGPLVRSSYRAHKLYSDFQNKKGH